MTAPVFVDTNVLVYARDAAAQAKQPVAAAWMERLWRERTGRLSWQVLEEFYVTVTRKLTPGLEPAAAREEIRTLVAWEPIGIDLRVLDGAWRLQDHHQLAWWDALIVASAELAECHYLLTEDLQAGQRFGALTVVDPFATPPTAELSAADSNQ